MGCIKFLHGTSFHLIERALDELIDEPKDEISRLRGLLFWLARDSGKDIRLRSILGETPEQKRERIFNQYQMLCLAPYTSEDKVAKEEAKISIMETTNPVRKKDAKDWLDKHLLWGSNLAEYIRHFDMMEDIERTPQAGDIVINSKLDSPFLSVVLNTANNIITIVNYEKENLESSYQSSALTILDIPESVLVLC